MRELCEILRIHPNGGESIYRVRLSEEAFSIRMNRSTAALIDDRLFSRMWELVCGGLKVKLHRLICNWHGWMAILRLIAFYFIIVTTFANVLRELRHIRLVGHIEMHSYANTRSLRVNLKFRKRRIIDFTEKGIGWPGSTYLHVLSLNVKAKEKWGSIKCTFQSINQSEFRSFLLAYGCCNNVSSYHFNPCFCMTLLPFCNPYCLAVDSSRDRVIEFWKEGWLFNSHPPEYRFGWFSYENWSAKWR